MLHRLFLFLLPLVAILLQAASAGDLTTEEVEDEIRIETPHLKAAIRKKGYVTGVAAQSLVDKKSGFGDAGFGLDIVDWIMEPGSDIQGFKPGSATG